MPKRLYRPSGFFVLRTPLLPFRYVEPLARGDEETIRELLADPVVREAIYLASPSLHEAIDAWLQDPSSLRARGVRESLTRYLLRAASRPTPFGLFAGLATGTLTETTNLSVAVRADLRRHTRLDMLYVTALAAKLVSINSIREHVLWYPNDALARVHGGVRYPLAIDNPERGREFVFTEADISPELDAVLHEAANGAKLTDLASVLTLRGYSTDDARAFLHELIEAQLLVCDLNPSLTSASPARGMEAFVPPISTANELLREIDASGVGVSASAYEAVARVLDCSPISPQRDRLFHVDLYKPAHDLTLGRRAVTELQCAIELIANFSSSATTDHGLLTSFAARFRERYDNRHVPLLEALDEENGIRLDNFVSNAYPDAVLDTLELGSVEPTSAREQLLHLRCLSPGPLTWELSEDDVRCLTQDALPERLPHGLAVMATIAARSCEAIEHGHFEVRIHSVSGTSGAELLARFGHGDERLRHQLTEHLRAEEALEPHAIHAEVYHLPEGRLGNILSRPPLRSHSLYYMGGTRGTVAPSDVIPLSDLDVIVRGGDVQLWSRSRRRRVIPRLTSAHAFLRARLAVYRFLGALSAKGSLGTFPWGKLSESPFRPRVTYGRIVFDVATWNLPTRELRHALSCERQFHELRERWRLPRWVLVASGDNTLPLDLDSAASRAELRRRTESRRNGVILKELWPEPSRLVAHDGTNAFSHEVIVPFLRATHPTPAAPAPSPVLSCNSARRSFPPGSEWLYAKVYVGPSGADRVLVREVAPLVQELRTSALRNWFFVRYTDPEPHLRLRFRGSPDFLLTDALPRLHSRMSRLIDAGTVHRLELGTYERELERYVDIELAEEAFEVDSDATLAALEEIANEPEPEVVRLAHALARFMDLLEHAPTPERLSFAERIYLGYLQEHGSSEALKRSLSRLTRTNNQSSLWRTEQPLVRAMAMRGRSSSHIAAKLPVQVWPSLLHMTAVRLFPARPRTHELVLWALLRAHYREVDGRGRVR